MLPLSQGEIDGARETFVHDLLGGVTPVLAGAASETSRDEYARRVTAGGMPVALRRPTGSSRSRWFSNYINLVIERDVVELSRVRQRDVLPRLLRQLAAQSGQMLNIAAAGQAIGIERSTAENYVKLLEAVFLIQRLPAWGTTLGSRVARQPKVHLVDSGVAAWLLNVSPDKIAEADPAALSGYGHLVETFAVGEILKHVSWWEAPVNVGHYRTGAGHEVDLVLERDDGQVIAFEIKAGSRVHDEDLRGIRSLASRLGKLLVAAIVLYTGPRSYEYDGVTMIPLDRLWT